MGAVITLIILGILLFLIEFLLIPGITIAGIGGGILTVGGIYLAYARFGTETGSIVLLMTLVASILIFALSLRSKTWKRAVLNTNIDGRMNEITDVDKILPGDKGITVTRLAPMGSIRINNLVIEVKCESGFVDPKTEVIVTKVTHSQIIVKPLN